MHKYLDKKTQQGRSMVETIGVLILIGLLSISGLSGYKYVITKQKANTLSTEILMRAAEIKKQIDNRAYSFHLTRFDSQVLGYNITLPNEEEPVILLTHLDERLCNLVKNRMQNLAKTTGNCDTQQNALAFDFGGKDYQILLEKQCQQACSACEICEAGKCIPIPENTSCITKDGDQGICINDICEVGHCNSNNDCSEGQYCADTNESEVQATPSMCTDMPQMTAYKAGGKTYFLSDSPRSWWDANNICDALAKDYNTNMSLISRTEFEQNNFHLSKILNTAIEYYFGVWTATPISKSAAYRIWLGGNIFGWWYNNKDTDYVLCQDLNEDEETGTECTQASDCIGDDMCVICDNGWCLNTNNNNTCAINGITSTCLNGTCSRSCSSNNDCSVGQYCADTNESATTATPATCQSIPFMEERNILGRRYYLSNTSHSWWDANNICKALSKQKGITMSLLSREDFLENNLAIPKKMNSVDFGSHNGTARWIWTNTKNANQAHYLANSSSYTSLFDLNNPKAAALCYGTDTPIEEGYECSQSEECYQCLNGWKVPNKNASCQLTNADIGCSVGICSKTGVCQAKNVTCEMSGVDSGCASCNQKGKCAITTSTTYCTKDGKSGVCSAEGICVE